MSELRAGQGAAALNVPEAKSTRYRDVTIALIAFVVLALLPMLTSSKFLLDFVIRCSAFGLFATSLNLLVGYTGLVSLGHAAFFGVGMYTTATLAGSFDVPFLWTLPAAAIVAAVRSDGSAIFALPDGDISLAEDELLIDVESLNVDAATEEEMVFFLHSRLDRADYTYLFGNTFEQNLTRAADLLAAATDAMARAKAAGPGALLGLREVQ